MVNKAAFGLGILAGTATLAALAVELVGNPGLGYLVAAHLVASLLVAGIVWFLLPNRYRTPRPMVTGFLFVFCFFIPVLGAVGMLLAVLIAFHVPRLRVYAPFRSLRLPHFKLDGQLVSPAYDPGGIRSRLKASGVSAGRRLKAVLALRDMPVRQMSGIVREALTDRADDVRLVAYGMLDEREKRINAEIHQASECLKTRGDEALRIVHLKRLAYLYWELVYEDLVRDDLMVHALEQSRKYAERALKASPEEASLWILLGKLHERRGDPEQARAAFTRAVELNAPLNSVLPYLAELAYREGHYTEVRRLLAKAEGLADVPAMDRVAQYWIGAQL